jgi:mono/diheme cytochrome c family protein
MRPTFFVIIVLCFVSSTHAQTASAIAELRGAELFRAACATCHGADGTGSPQSMTGFDLDLPDFTQCGFSSVEPDADWATVIREGGPVRVFDRKMPAFGDALSDDQILSVIGYIRSLCTDSRWPRGELNLPRALATEKAFPENEALLVTTFSRKPGAVSNEFIYEHRIGSQGQYEIILPLNLQQHETGAGWNRGLSDVKFAYKHVMFHSIRRGSILSLGGEVSLPTGKEALGLGEGRTVLEPFAAFGQILPHDGFLQLQTGIEHAVTGDALSEVFWRSALGKTFTQGAGRAWSPMIEAVAGREFEDGHKAEWDVLPQMQVTLSKRQHIMVNAGLRIPINERSDRHTEFVMYLLWDWFDGGIFSGW